MEPLHRNPLPPQTDEHWRDKPFNDLALRKALRKTLYGFCLLYLPHYFDLEPATFHYDMFASLEDQTIRFLELIGFRGCAKSTAASLALPIWAALEKPNLYPFIIPIADTGQQAAANIANIKLELEDNWLLKNDYGHIPIRAALDSSPEDATLESEEEWQAKNLLLDNGVRILARSTGQKVRGIRHRQFRPKLICVDDPEDLERVNTQESRDKTTKWFKGEVVPALDTRFGRLVLIGNFLHLDGLMARMKNSGIFTVKEFPFLDENGNQTWPQLFPTPEALEKQKILLGDVAWQREMLLHPIADEGQDVHPEDVHYYDDPPFDDGNHLAHGVDLAISTKESADFTAIVSGEVTWPNGKIEIYIQPHPIIRRMTFSETMDALDNVRKSNAMSSEFFVEAVAYQQAAIEEMERRAFSVQAMHPIKDKRARLRVAARYIKMGVVKFPRHGCEQLITQLLGFGIEKHDDAVDALVYLILGLVGEGVEEQKVHYI